MEKKDLLKKASDLLFGDCSIEFKRALVREFPELAGNENIPKEISEFLSDVFYRGKNANFDRWEKSDCSKWLKWLEKESSSRLILDPLKGLWHTFKDLKPDISSDIIIVYDFQSSKCFPALYGGKNLVVEFRARVREYLVESFLINRYVSDNDEWVPFSCLDLCKR